MTNRGSTGPQCQIVSELIVLDKNRLYSRTRMPILEKYIMWHNSAPAPEKMPYEKVGRRSIGPPLGHRSVNVPENTKQTNSQYYHKAPRKVRRRSELN